jgi:hypothetical protein
MLWDHSYTVIIGETRTIPLKGVNIMVEPIRLSAEETRRRVSEDSALLVCAYEDDEKFEDNHLQGAISFNIFKSRLPELAKDQAIIFYCA